MSEIESYLITIVGKSVPAFCSPYYSNPCSKECKVCNMDKELYSKVRALIEEAA